MPWLTTCCCGFSVRTGTKAIAILSLVYSVLGLLMVATFKIERDRLVIEKHRSWGSSFTDYSIHKEFEVGLPTLRPRTIIFSTATPDIENQTDRVETGSGKPPLDGSGRRRLEVIMTVYAVSVSVNFLVSLSLLAGVRLGQRWLLVPWISWNVLSLLISQLAVFYAPNKAMTTVPDLFSTFISVYCIFCVCSYFQELTGQPGTTHVTNRIPPWPECGMTLPERGDQEAGTGQEFAGPHLSPRRPHLVVALPPSQDLGPPPAYPSLGSDCPPSYDPPPPYPGSPDAKEKEDLAGILGESSRPEQGRRKSMD